MIHINFKITSLCNKKCSTCCTFDNLHPKNHLIFAEFREKIQKIKDAKMEVTSFSLSGGEVFLYKKQDKSLLDFVEVIRIYFPNTPIVLKTSGWANNLPLDNKLNSLYLYKSISLALGISLFQNKGKDFIERARHMIPLILKNQNQLRLDVIYNKENLEETFVSLCELFPNLNMNSKFLEIKMYPGKALMTVLSMMAKNQKILLYTAPAYDPHQRSNQEAFYSFAEVKGPCSTLTDHAIFMNYDTDLNLSFCNDPYYDYKNFCKVRSKETTFQEDVKMAHKTRKYLYEKFENQSISTNKIERCDQCCLWSKRMQEYA